MDARRRRDESDRGDAPIAAERKPRDDELDRFGVTNRGKVRIGNQDHFLIASLRKRINIGQSNCHWIRIPLHEERVASFVMVATAWAEELKGEQASRMALEGATRYLAETARCYYQFDEEGVNLFVHALEEAAVRCSQRCGAGLARRERGRNGNHAHALHWRVAVDIPPSGGRFPLLPAPRWRADPDLAGSTVAQELADQGIMPSDLNRHFPLTHVLSSSIGGRQTRTGRHTDPESVGNDPPSL